MNRTMASGGDGSGVQVENAGVRNQGSVSKKLPESFSIRSEE